MLPMCCWCCACRFVVCSRVSHCLMLAMRSLLCVRGFLVSSSVSHALLAALRTLSLCLLSIGLLRFVCCAFAGNTCPHGQANLRTCSVASHLLEAHLTAGFRQTESTSSRELPVIDSYRACAEYKRTRKEIKWRICSSASSTKSLTSPKSGYTKNAFFKH